MANNHFNAWIYGEIKGEPPYSTTGGIVNATTYDYPANKAGIAGFPSTGTIFYELSPAVTIGNVSCNAVIELLPTGLNVHGRKFATDATVATLTTAAT